MPRNPPALNKAWFAALFLDNQRTAAIYNYIRGGLTRLVTISGNISSGDSASLTVDVRTFLDHESDWTPSTFTVELKKRGPNWYVDEVKSPRFPGGAYAQFKAKLGSLR